MDEERARRKLAELKEKRKNRNFWMAKPNKNYIRVLPNWTGDLAADFYYETKFHKKLGTNRDKTSACLIAEGKPECPVCKTCNELWETKDAENSALAKDMKATTRVYYNIIDLNDKAKGVQVMVSGVDVLEQLLAWCTNPKYGDVTDPIKGRNIELVMTEGKNTRSGFNEYDVQPDPDRSPVEKPEWLEAMVDLKALVKPLSYESLEALMFGRTVEEETPPQAPPEETPKEQPKAKPEPEVKQEAPAPIPAGKACFGKYDAEDVECVTCKKDKACEEDKAKRKAGVAALKAKIEAPTPPPQETPKEAPKETPKEAPKEAPKGKGPSAEEKNITDVLAKIEERRKKRTGAGA